MAKRDVLEINELNFEREVLRSEQPFLLTFSAPWCGPCKAMTPALERIASDNPGTIKVGKANIDDAASLAATFNVRGAPTTLVFKHGQEVTRRLGAVSHAGLVALVAS